MGIIKIFVVYDDLEWLNRFSDYIRSISYIRIIGYFRDYRDIYPLSFLVDVDVILYNIEETDSWNGLFKAAQLSSVCNANVIFLSSNNEKGFIHDVIKNSKIDTIDKSKMEDIPVLINEVYNDGYFGKSSFLDKFKKEFIRLKKIEHLYLTEKKNRKENNLTPTELIILQLIEQGHSQAYIAEQQFISLRTVKNHVRSILRKMNESSSKHAAKKAKEMGLIK